MATPLEEYQRKERLCKLQAGLKGAGSVSDSGSQLHKGTSQRAHNPNRRKERKVGPHADIATPITSPLTLNAMRP